MIILVTVSEGYCLGFSDCMVCASVRQDNLHTRAVFACGLSSCIDAQSMQ